MVLIQVMDWKIIKKTEEPKWEYLMKKPFAWCNRDNPKLYKLVDKK